MLTTVRLEMLSGVLPRFLSVTVFRELLPRSCAPKLRDVGERLSASPVPLRLIVCGLFKALSVIVRLAVLVPMAEGVKLLNAIQDVYLSKEITVA